ncbi:hypothetical protein DYBT9275_02538 [Dyadobacter sp. CECT 9275]|uniref:Uncharacterized protein n=1 Tax=Dyadobacter helix TaxID=2822344 RepID=A0A916NCB2_9BACT|nr:hypothetical protein DYBT9275_02538 [Dyadobacter sp. CECT 9275]
MFKYNTKFIYAYYLIKFIFLNLIFYQKTFRIIIYPTALKLYDKDKAPQGL